MSADPPSSSHTLQRALAALAASGSVICDSDIDVDGLNELARAAAQWGASLTIRNSGQLAVADVQHIARSGRGRVTFDFS